MEQLIMLPERLILLIDMSLRNLESHILIGDFRNIRNEKHSRKAEYKDSNGQIDPLHALQSGDIIRSFSEESIRAQHRANDSPNCIKGLGEVDSNLRVAGRTAD
jgi:hypothetical protein